MYHTIVTTLLRRFCLKRGQTGHIWRVMLAVLEKFACDRINYILFSLEHVIKMGEEKMSSKRRVCVMHVFNQGKEGLVGKKGLPSHCCRIFFLFYFFLYRQVEKTSCEMWTNIILRPCFVSASCTVSGVIICKYKVSCCFVSWFLKEQSSQCDLVKVDRKYQVQ